ncbi:MAG: LexA family transcriptional regulator [Bacteroidetes bacterium]|nr:LexA family transcriptional regulator [Bacteroidota bacterium]
MSTIGKRIKIFAKENYKSVSALTRAMGMSATALAPYIKGSIIPGIRLQEKLKDAGCDIDWLMTGNKNTVLGLDLQVIKIKPMSKNIKVSVMISSGNYDNLFLDDEGVLYTDPSLLYNETSFYVIVNDISLLGQFGISEGDWLLVDTKKQPLVNFIVLALIDGKSTVKRLIEHDNKFYLESDNPEDSLVLLDNESTRIIGIIKKIERLIL